MSTTPPIDYAATLILNGTQIMLRFAAADHGCGDEEAFVHWLEARLRYLIKTGEMLKSHNSLKEEHKHRVTMVSVGPGTVIQYMGPWSDFVHAAEEHEKAKKLAALGPATVAPLIVSPRGPQRRR
jgi:hypothetical protein